MNRYLTNKHKSDCCGCGACVAACMTHCIGMDWDDEGFEYPKIVNDACNHCGKCTRCCPMEKEEDSIIPDMNAFAAYTKNDEIIRNSSSGGIFSELADYFLKKNGVIFGASLDEEHRLHHIGIETAEDLSRLRGSKYIQSRMGSVFLQCKKALESDRSVLFTGTPCQIYALQQYLGKPYPKLFTLDLICHGVPSQMMFVAYVRYLESKHKATLVGINFRDKLRNGWSITLRYTMQKKGKQRDYVLIQQLSEYFSGFLGGYTLRESCYKCPFASLKRFGDITLGDFWGYQKTRPDLAHQEGLSLLLVNTDKGRHLMDVLANKEVRIEPVSEDSLLQSENKNLYKPTIRPNARDLIYQELGTYGFGYIAKKYLRSQFTIRNYAKNYLPQGLVKSIGRYSAKNAMKG